MIGMPAEIYLPFTDFKHSFLNYWTVTGVAKCKSDIITTVRCVAVVLSVCGRKYLCPGAVFHASKSTDNHCLSLSYAWIVVCVLFMFLFHCMHCQWCIYVFAMRTFILNGDINIVEILQGNIKILNHLTPNDHFSGRTAPLTYRCCIFLFIQQIYVLNILNMLHTLRFFPLQNVVYFIMLPFFGSCIIHNLYTECAKF